MAYTYDPAQIGSNSKDKMRFELGDTFVANGADTCALSDEEITAALTAYKTFKMAKFKLVESIYMRFSKEVDTSIGGLSLGVRARAEQWSKLYADLKSEMAKGASAPSFSLGGGSSATAGAPIFTIGMHDSRETE